MKKFLFFTLFTCFLFTANLSVYADTLSVYADLSQLFTSDGSIPTLSLTKTDNLRLFDVTFDLNSGTPITNNAGEITGYTMIDNAFTFSSDFIKIANALGIDLSATPTSVNEVTYNPYTKPDGSEGLFCTFTYDAGTGTDNFISYFYTQQELFPGFTFEAGYLSNDYYTGDNGYLVFNDEAAFNNIHLEENSAVPTPEPATMLLLGTGLVGLAGFRKKFKKA